MQKAKWLTTALILTAIAAGLYTGNTGLEYNLTMKQPAGETLLSA